MTRGFGIVELRVQLKTAIQTAGIEGEATTLFLEDHQLTTDAILEAINSLLSSGEIPGLYSHEELEPLLAPLKEKAMEAGTFRTAYEFFVHQVTQNLHVVISMEYVQQNKLQIVHHKSFWLRLRCFFRSAIRTISVNGMKTFAAPNVHTCSRDFFNNFFNESSPTNANFLVRCESNPALYTRCGLLWMGSWTPSSMRDLPMMLPGVTELIRGEFEEEDSPQAGEGKESEGKDESKGEGKDDISDPSSKMNGGRNLVAEEQMIDLALSIHESVDNAAPLEFVSFLKSWKDLHASKRGGISKEIKKLRSGLSKLEAAKDTVDELSKNAKESERDLNEAQKQADKAMDSITKTLSEASGRRTEVKELQEEVAEKDKVTRERQDVIKNELSTTQPILDAAKRAVGGIKSEHLNEIVGYDKKLVTRPQ